MNTDKHVQGLLFPMERPVILCKRFGRVLKGRQSRQDKIGPGCKKKRDRKPRQLALKLGKR